MLQGRDFRGLAGGGFDQEVARIKCPGRQGPPELEIAVLKKDAISLEARAEVLDAAQRGRGCALPGCL